MACHAHEIISRASATQLSHRLVRLPRGQSRAFHLSSSPNSIPAVQSRRVSKAVEASSPKTIAQWRSPACRVPQAARSPLRYAQQRTFTTTASRMHGDLVPPKPGEERKVTFIDKEGHEHTFEVADGSNLLDIAQANDLEMEGACGGSCACSTCHVIVQDEGMYDKMDEPSDDENDMLDLAFGLTETSRLGCQVEMSKELDGLVIKLPSMTRNMQASDFAEKEKKP